MKAKDWQVLISVILFLVLLSPTIQVNATPDISEWSFGYYEIFHFWNQRIIWIVLSTAFLLYVILSARLVLSFGPFIVFFTNWILGGLFITLVRDEMYYVVQQAFGVGFPQKDIWFSMIFSIEDIAHSIIMGLAISIISMHFSERILDTDLSFSKKQGGRADDFEELIQLITETPPTSTK